MNIIIWQDLVNIIFDLDGTLICSRERLFQLFNDLVPDSELSFEEYWVLKFSRLSNEDILKNYFNYAPADVERFREHWMRLIEDDVYLRYDKPIEGVIPCLQRLVEHSALSLYVCTARQSREQAVAQLARLGFDGVFRSVLVTEQRNEKEYLIRETVKYLSEQDWIVGDTGKDIQIGKDLKLKTCAVLSGFMNKFNLLKYNPDVIIDNVGKFNELLVR